MSGIWADFDPLSRARAKPAAPVTSMQQAEATPATGKTSSSGLGKASNTADQNDAGGEEVAGDILQGERATLLRAELLGADAGNSSPAKGDETPEGKSEKVEHDGAAQVSAQEVDQSSDPEPDQADHLAHSELIGEPALPCDGPNEPVSNSANSLLSTTDQDASLITSEAVADRADAHASIGKQGASDSAGDDQAPESAPEPANSSNVPELLSPDPSEEAAEWPPKLIPAGDGASESEPAHHGDLRKNSIAAMKELGSPEAGDPNAAALPEDAPFDFQRFMTMLRTRSADPIARYVKSFLQEFSRGAWSPKQQEKIVADFQKFIGLKMREFEPFASLGKKDRRNASEGMEKLIMNRLYARTFPPKMLPILRTDGHNEDLLRDHVFEEKLRLWSWVEGRHLDINDGYLQSNFIELASTELGRLHQFKSPRDKTICVLNCSKVVWALIRQARLEQNADSFLPLLIYVVIRAQPQHLVSNINYIQRFRSKEFLKGETAYYLSTLASAVAFIETLDNTSLTISDEEFELKMDESVKKEDQRKAALQNEQRIQQTTDLSSDEDPAHEGESSAAVLAASAGMLVERVRNLTTKFLEDLSTAPEDATEGAHATEDARENGEPGAPGTPGDDDAHDQAARDQAAQARVRQQRQQAHDQYRQEEQAARDASREEFRTEQLQRQQFNETSEMLQQMFPVLDKDVIEDVMHECGTNVGSAVDLCLALTGAA